MRAWWERYFWGFEAPVWPLMLLLIGVVVAIMVAVGLTVGFEGPPNANELCAQHGGVANVGGGGWSDPLVATCKDGYAGTVGMR